MEGQRPELVSQTDNGTDHGSAYVPPNGGNHTGHRSPSGRAGQTGNQIGKWPTPPVTGHLLPGDVTGQRAPVTGQLTGPVSSTHRSVAGNEHLQCSTSVPGDLRSLIEQQRPLGPDDPEYFVGYRPSHSDRNLGYESFLSSESMAPHTATRDTDPRGLVSYPTCSKSGDGPYRRTQQKRQNSLAADYPASIKRPFCYPSAEGFQIHPPQPPPESQGGARGPNTHAYPYEYTDAPNTRGIAPTVTRVVEANGQITHEGHPLIHDSEEAASSSDDQAGEQGDESLEELDPTSRPSDLPPPPNEIEEADLMTDDESVNFKGRLTKHIAFTRGICPVGNLPKPRAPKLTGSLNWAEEHEELQSFDVLPHSVVVRNTVQFLESQTDEIRSKPDYQVTATDAKRLTMPSTYKVHAPAFHSLAPPLDSDASLCDLRRGNAVSISIETVKRWETRARSIVDTCSYLEMFNAARYNSEMAGARDQTPGTTLLRAQARASRHAIGGAVSLAADLCQMRRDVALATSKQLTDRSKRLLRASPLGSDSLFAGKIQETLKLNRAEQESAALNRAMHPKPIARPKAAAPVIVNQPTKKASNKKGKGKQKFPPTTPAPPNQRKHSGSAGRGKPAKSGPPPAGRGRGGRPQ